MNHQICHCQIDHRFAGFRQRFVVFAQASVFPKPRKGSFHHPSARQDHKPMDIVVAFNDFQNPMSEFLDPLDEFPGISAIRPDQGQSRKPFLQFSQNQPGSISILKVGRMNHHGDYQTDRINDNMAFPSRNLLSGIKTTVPPFSAVFTDWLSIMAAEGLACRPASMRTWVRRWS